ncbi:MAG TPA: hypothetical protein VMU27_03270 [Candidatus Paceibacterota bacterium]|nr:hypothetical protein [Candidatus Paceibacterota bacterium]
MVRTQDFGKTIWECFLRCAEFRFLSSLSLAERDAVDKLCRAKKITKKGASQLLDLDVLDRGPKTIADLLEEVRSGQVRIDLDERGRLVRTALSVKVRVFDSEGRLLKEIGRRYHNNHAYIAGSRKWSYSETVRWWRGETALEAAIRGAWEELDLEVTAEQFVSTSIWVSVAEGSKVRRSKVFKGIISCAILADTFDLHLPDKGGNFDSALDGGTTIYYRWSKKKPHHMRSGPA